MPQAKFIAGFWMLGEDNGKRDEWTKAAGADFGATSLAEATAIVVEQALNAQKTAQPTPARPSSSYPSDLVLAAHRHGLRTARRWGASQHCASHDNRRLQASPC